jgi:hypothetical protein
MWISEKKVMEGWVKLYNDKPQNLYCSFLYFVRKPNVTVERYY